jgi:hypothetical protein
MHAIHRMTDNQNDNLKRPLPLRFRSSRGDPVGDVLQGLTGWQFSWQRFTLEFLAKLAYAGIRR